MSDLIWLIEKCRILRKADDRRRFRRCLADDVRVLIDGQAHSVRDLSVTGLRLHPYHGPLRLDDSFDFTFEIRAHERVSELECRGAVTRRDEFDLGATFETINRHAAAVIRRYVYARERRREIVPTNATPDGKGAPPL